MQLAFLKMCNKACSAQDDDRAKNTSCLAWQPNSDGVLEPVQPALGGHRSVLHVLTLTCLVLLLTIT